MSRNRCANYLLKSDTFCSATVCSAKRRETEQDLAVPDRPMMLTGGLANVAIQSARNHPAGRRLLSRDVPPFLERR